MRMSPTATAVAAGLALLSAVQPAQAHHSYAAFDTVKTVSLQGTVKRWEWTNPHSFLYVTVKGTGDVSTDWEIESASPSLMKRVGFAADSLKPGDKVTVRIHPHRIKTSMGSLVAVDLPNGKTLAFTILDPNAK